MHDSESCRARMSLKKRSVGTNQVFYFHKIKSYKPRACVSPRVVNARLFFQHIFVLFPVPYCMILVLLCFVPYKVCTSSSTSIVQLVRVVVKNKKQCKLLDVTMTTTDKYYCTTALLVLLVELQQIV